MKYENKDTNLSKVPNVYEITSGAVQCNGEEVLFSNITHIWINKRFDGF